jgi:glutaredoxin
MRWAWLRWWRRRAHPAGAWQIVLYTRQGCHLCDEAWDLLEEARRQYGFAFDSVDVDTRPELAEQYGLCVPVVVVNGRVRFRGVVNQALLKRLFLGGV